MVVRDGVVLKQSPNPGDKESSGSPIEVQMGVQKVAIPAFTPNTTTLAAYEAQLKKLGFTNIKAVSAGADPTLQPNIVSGVSPSAGTSVSPTTQIIISVKNLNGTPAVTPSPSPTAKPSPSPSPSPSPYTESDAESDTEPDAESDTRVRRLTPTP